MNYFRENIRRMQGYVPGEQPQDQQYVKLNTNENPYPPSPKVLDAIRASANDTLRLYPDPVATKLREKIGQTYGFPAECVIAGQGGDDILNLIIRACAAKGDRVASLAPSYTLYDTLARLQEAELVGVSTADELADAGAKVSLLCNPNAPTGVWTKKAVLDSLARRLDGLLVIDEAYADFAQATCLDLASTHPNVVVVRSLSKSFSLAGMRLGFAVSSPPVVEQLFKVKDSYNLSRVAQAAGIAALDDLEYMRRNTERVIATRERVQSEFQAMALEFIPSRSNFILVRVENAGEVKGGLMERGVLVRYFDTPDLRDFIRVSMGTDEDMDTFLEALRAVLAQG
jgi:histidinol-phosphate aminotransferase